VRKDDSGVTGIFEFLFQILALAKSLVCCRKRDLLSASGVGNSRGVSIPNLQIHRHGPPVVSALLLIGS
jgi:hypothetical protein